MLKFIDIDVALSSIESSKNRIVEMERETTKFVHGTKT